MKGIPYIAVCKVNLNDDREFDPSVFDNFAKQFIVALSDPDVSGTKFIVVQDVMYVFTTNVQHDEAYEYIKAGLNLEKKQECAGRIMVFFDREDGVGRFPRRVIYDNSETLEVKRLLRVADSEFYKTGKLAQTLGQFFAISN